MAKQFSIPKKKQEIKDNLHQVTDFEAKYLLKDIKKNCLSTEFLERITVLDILMVHNPVLTEKYKAKKKQLKEMNLVIKEDYGFFCHDEDSKTSIAKNGLKTGNTKFNGLGVSKYGVYISRYFDAELESTPFRGPKEIFIFQYVAGKSKSVCVDFSTRCQLEPTPNYDSHVSSEVPSINESCYLKSAKSKIYLFEYTEDSIPSLYPRHILPYAILKVERKINPAPAVSKLHPSVKEDIAQPDLSGVWKSPHEIAKLSHQIKNDPRLKTLKPLLEISVKQQMYRKDESSIVALSRNSSRIQANNVNQKRYDPRLKNATFDKPAVQGSSKVQDKINPYDSSRIFKSQEHSSILLKPSLKTATSFVKEKKKISLSDYKKKKQVVNEAEVDEIYEETQMASKSTTYSNNCNIGQILPHKCLKKTKIFPVSDNCTPAELLPPSFRENLPPSDASNNKPLPTSNNNAQNTQPKAIALDTSTTDAQVCDYKKSFSLNNTTRSSKQSLASKTKILQDISTAQNTVSSDCHSRNTQKFHKDADESSNEMSVRCLSYKEIGFNHYNEVFSHPEFEPNVMLVDFIKAKAKGKKTCHICSKNLTENVTKQLSNWSLQPGNSLAQPQSMVISPSYRRLRTANEGSLSPKELEKQNNGNINGTHTAMNYSMITNSSPLPLHNKNVGYSLRKACSPDLNSTTEEDEEQLNISESSPKRELNNCNYTEAFAANICVVDTVIEQSLSIMVKTETSTTDSNTNPVSLSPSTPSLFSLPCLMPISSSSVYPLTSTPVSPFQQSNLSAKPALQTSVNSSLTEPSNNYVTQISFSSPQSRSLRLCCPSSPGPELLSKVPLSHANISAYLSDSLLGINFSTPAQIGPTTTASKAIHHTLSMNSPTGIHSHLPSYLSQRSVSSLPSPMSGPPSYLPSQGQHFSKSQAVTQSPLSLSLPPATQMHGETMSLPVPIFSVQHDELAIQPQPTHSVQTIVSSQNMVPLTSFHDSQSKPLIAEAPLKSTHCLTNPKRFSTQKNKPSQPISSQNSHKEASSPSDDFEASSSTHSKLHHPHVYQDANKVQDSDTPNDIVSSTSTNPNPTYEPFQQQPLSPNHHQTNFKTPGHEPFQKQPSLPPTHNQTNFQKSLSRYPNLPLPYLQSMNCTESAPVLPSYHMPPPGANFFDQTCSSTYSYSSPGYPAPHPLSYFPYRSFYSVPQSSSFAQASQPTGSTVPTPYSFPVGPPYDLMPCISLIPFSQYPSHVIMPGAVVPSSLVPPSSAVRMPIFESKVQSPTVQSSIVSNGQHTNQQNSEIVAEEPITASVPACPTLPATPYTKPPSPPTLPEASDSPAFLHPPLQTNKQQVSNDASNNSCPKVKVLEKTFLGEEVHAKTMSPQASHNKLVSDKVLNESFKILFSVPIFEQFLLKKDLILSKCQEKFEKSKIKVKSKIKDAPLAKKTLEIPLKKFRCPSPLSIDLCREDVTISYKKNIDSSSSCYIIDTPPGMNDSVNIVVFESNSDSGASFSSSDRRVFLKKLYQTKHNRMKLRKLSMSELKSQPAISSPIQVNSNIDQLSEAPLEALSKARETILKEINLLESSECESTGVNSESNSQPTQKNLVNKRKRNNSHTRKFKKNCADLNTKETVKSNNIDIVTISSSESDFDDTQIFKYKRKRKCSDDELEFFWNKRIKDSNDGKKFNSFTGSSTRSSKLSLVSQEILNSVNGSNYLLDSMYSEQKGSQPPHAQTCKVVKNLNNISLDASSVTEMTEENAKDNILMNTVTVKMFIFIQIGHLFQDDLADKLPWPLETALNNLKTCSELLASRCKTTLLTCSNLFQLSNEAFNRQYIKPMLPTSVTRFQYRFVKSFSTCQFLVEVKVLAKCYTIWRQQEPDSCWQNYTLENLLHLRAENSKKYAQVKAELTLLNDEISLNNHDSKNYEKLIGLIHSELEKSEIDHANYQIYEDEIFETLELKKLPDLTKVSTSDFTFNTDNLAFKDSQYKTNSFQNIIKYFVSLFKDVNFGYAHFSVPDQLLLEEEKDSTLYISHPIPLKSFKALLQLRSQIETLKNKPNMHRGNIFQLTQQRKKLLSSFVETNSKEKADKLNMLLQRFLVTKKCTAQIIGPKGMEKMPIFTSLIAATQDHLNFTKKELVGTKS